jgi:hypothetical protein
VSARLARAATARVSVLVVPVPGWTATRCAVERAVRARGWRPALSPADADLLVVCGAPGPRLAAAVDLVWEQLPGPRARVAATAPSTVGPALDEGVAELVDADRQRRDAAGRPRDPEMGVPPEPDAAGDDGSGDDGDADDGSGDTDHGDMEMAPGGIPLAGGGEEDRDGLDLDVLHLPLGPVLLCWPAGLLLHCTLHGDVVTAARAELLPPAEGVAPDEPPPRAAQLLDAAARVLTLAGWESAAGDAVGIRDDLLTGADDRVATRLDRLHRRLGRSRLLRWSLRGVGTVDAGRCAELGLDRRCAGDAHDRLRRLVADARAALDTAAEPPAAPLDALPDLLAGLELGAVRLTVASLDLDSTARVAQLR